MRVLFVVEAVRMKGDDVRLQSATLDVAPRREERANSTDKHRRVKIERKAFNRADRTDYTRRGHVDETTSFDEENEFIKKGFLSRWRQV